MSFKLCPNSADQGGTRVHIVLFAFLHAQLRLPQINIRLMDMSKSFAYKAIDENPSGDLLVAK